MQSLSATYKWNGKHPESYDSTVLTLYNGVRCHQTHAVIHTMHAILYIEAGLIYGVLGDVTTLLIHIFNYSSTNLTVFLRHSSGTVLARMCAIFVRKQT